MSHTEPSGTQWTRKEGTKISIILCTLERMEDESSLDDFISRTPTTRKVELRNTEKGKRSEVSPAPKAASLGPLFLTG